MKILVVGDFQGRVPEKLKRKIAKEDFDFVIGVGDYAGIEDWRAYFFDMFKSVSKGGEWINAKDYFGKKKYKRLLKKDFEAGKKVLSFLNNLKRRVIFVFGNSDDEWYNYPFEKGRNKANGNKLNFVKKLKGTEDITYSKTKLFGIKFTGFGGYMDVGANWNKRDDEEKRKRMMRRVGRTERKLTSLMKGETDVLVLHYPPRGVFDIIRDKNNPYNGKSAGIEMFRKAILKHKPKLVLCGHMHEYQGVKRLGKSLVVNPGDAEKGKYAVVDYSDGKVKVRFE